MLIAISSFRCPAKWRIGSIVKSPFRAATLIAAIILAFAPFEVTAADLDNETRVLLQVSLRSYIDNKSADGSYPYFDAEKGEPQSLALKNLHPVIFQKDDYYLMCADFLNADGEAVLIDYIVRKHRDGFHVEQEIRGRRSYLTQIFDRVF